MQFISQLRPDSEAIFLCIEKRWSSAEISKLLEARRHAQKQLRNDKCEMKRACCVLGEAATGCNLRKTGPKNLQPGKHTFDGLVTQGRSGRAQNARVPSVASFGSGCKGHVHTRAFGHSQSQHTETL